MRKIAILKGMWSNYDDSDILINSITDWVEVSEEDYKILKSNLWNIRNTDDAYTIVEYVANQKEFIDNTVAAYLKKAKALEAVENKRKEEAKKKKQEALERKMIKQAESEKKLLEKLKAKYESEQS